MFEFACFEQASCAKVACCRLGLLVLESIEKRKRFDAGPSVWSPFAWSPLASPDYRDCVSSFESGSICQFARYGH
jgi:hypothetical protein